MTIAIQIDADTERLARKLAEASGKPLPQVVKEAIEASAAAAGVKAEQPEAGASLLLCREELLARMNEITTRVARLPVLDTRSEDEILGYDEHGVFK